jgi:hypothetical protein
MTSEDRSADNDFVKAQQLINEEKTSRATACGEEIDAALEKYGCVIIGTPFFTEDGRVVVNVLVKSIDAAAPQD